MKKGDLLGLVSIVVMLGGFFALFLFAPRSPSPTIFQPIEVSGSTLVAVDATSAGVVVDAVLGQKGFVTLHGALGDAPGPILGMSDILDVGMHSDMALSSTQPLLPGQKYILLLVADDGDGIYEKGIDRPVMVDGQVIRVPISL